VPDIIGRTSRLKLTVAVAERAGSVWAEGPLAASRARQAVEAHRSFAPVMLYF